MLYKQAPTRVDAAAGKIVSFVSDMFLTIIGVMGQVKIVGNSSVIFHVNSPTIRIMPPALAESWLVSVMDRSLRAARDHGSFENQLRQSLGTSARLNQAN